LFLERWAEYPLPVMPSSGYDVNLNPPTCEEIAMNPIASLGLPTNSLYATVTVLGITILVGAGYSQLTYHDPLMNKYIEKTRQTNQDILDIQKYTQAMENEERAAMNSTQPSEQLDKMNALMDRVKSRMLEVMGKMRDKIQDIHEIEYLKAKTEQMGYVITGGFVVGSVLTTWGAIMWWRRVQRYQDKIVKNQAEPKPKTQNKKKK